MDIQDMLFAHRLAEALGVRYRPEFTLEFYLAQVEAVCKLVMRLEQIVERMSETVANQAAEWE